MTVAEHIARGLSNAVEVGDCLEWQGPFGCGGTTPIVKGRVLGKRSTRNFIVCRTMWEQKNGPVPEGKVVYRKCCNNACVREDHLRCGTRAEFKENLKKHGRTKHKAATKLRMIVSARARPTIKLSLEKAREIRALKAENLTNRAISRALGVSECMVGDIVREKAWREIVGNPFAGLGA